MIEIAFIDGTPTVFLDKGKDYYFNDESGFFYVGNDEGFHIGAYNASTVRYIIGDASLWLDPDLRPELAENPAYSHIFNKENVSK